jgi:hypothetical protein
MAAYGRAFVVLAFCALVTAVDAQPHCAGKSTAPWTAAGKGYALTIAVDGATCATASASYSALHDGQSLWSKSVKVPGNLAFQDLNAPADLARLLPAILHDAQLSPAADVLPTWPTGRSDRVLGGPDVHYYVGEGITPEQWNGWRSAKAPLLMFAQGIETVTLLVLDQGQVREIGYLVQ